MQPLQGQSGRIPDFGDTLLRRSNGITPSEQYLAGLCERAFLSLWSYPNVFRDQGNGKTGDGKEVCDLLLVFGEDVVLFSDKSCAFPSTGDLTTDWSRWYKRAVERSANQLYGGERWIREHPDRVFLDRMCTIPFPFPMPPKDSCRFHLVVVALGAKDRCKREIKGSGSLVLWPEIVGEAHVGPDCRPFCIGDVDPQRTFIHVFDDVTLDAILLELDTAGDFVDYLTRKEHLVRSGKLAAAEGEENLLAYYVTTMGDGGHDFVFPKTYDKLYARDGHWRQHVTSDARARRKAADRCSYLWDGIIEELTFHGISGKSVVPIAAEIKDVEEAMRIMAAERRIMRRMHSQALIERVLNGPADKTAFRIVISNDNPTLAYVFMAMPEAEDERAYRDRRRWFLEQYCFVLSWKRRELRTIVGLATESGNAESGRSYDVVVYRPQEWTDELIREAESVQARFGILRDENLSSRPFQGREYPDPPRPTHKARKRVHVIGSPSAVITSRRIGRNSTCPCGSGRKFKHCCMRG